MPDYPILSGGEIVRALERLGFVQVRQRGSHVVLRNGTIGCVVPLHREVKRGTLGGIIRQAGVTPDAFLAAVARG
ncbi:type II toxin-antitoxin system HicA family toxin [Sphingomonas radiodurans]|uniref:type II toxin-antitoxin system HicA family toxin n=1 Tax=Sphingomonas radiodurans TaxID=2890321 RepID=UPI001E3610BE|nr:type II toxin-antitoxin system HicA family toxin [Sphingomonas radiodurans]WBH17287.1 type II toxin-antitoxin system HicA family toxin [Sphingomonas radiodurans]